jgi:spore germination protein KC
MNRYIIFLIAIFFCLSLSGCWNYNELDDLYIVAGMSVDKAKDGELLNVAVEVINSEETNLKSNIESQVIEADGISIFDAVREIVKISAKKLYWSHATTIIISEDVAKEGILPILDWISRDQEPRLNMNVFISREKTAKELLTTITFPTVIHSFELEHIVTESKDYIDTPIVEVYELTNEFGIPKNHSVLPTVQIVPTSEGMSNKISSGAVFKDDKLIGYLTESDVLPYLFIKNKVNGGLLHVINKDFPQDRIILEIFESKTKIKPVFSDKDISFDLEISTSVNIGELNTKTNIDYLSKDGREILRKEAEENLEADIQNVFKTVQEEFKIDIFGFGNEIRKKHPQVWKTIEKDWDTIFSELKLNIKCNIDFRNSGHFIKPIEVLR